MTIKRQSTRRPKDGKVTKVIMAILLVLVLIWAWSEYKKGNLDLNLPINHKDVATAQTVDYGDLEHVAIPQTLKSEIINYPGFTVSFNSKYKQPNYVVWELTAHESRSNVVKNRTDNFAPDPKVKGCPTLDDYRGSGYDRGHMAPAADMKWSLDAMNSCFLLTNMSPQDHTLNSGAWSKLEDKCRDWALRDSAIVIICGPVLTDKLTRRIGQSKVAVPERYFKVILAPYADPPRGIGFIMPNGNVPGGVQASAVSIDQVEAVTGYDFFSSLPDDIESRVESQCNYPVWNQR